MQRAFHKFALAAAYWTGHSAAFVAAVLLIVAWLISGPFFGFSETWQLIINTGTTIITFLMVVIIQHTQNADTRAIQTKLDEVIRALPEADNDMAGIERDG